MKRKSKMTKTLIVATFLLIIVAFITTVNACPPNRILVIAKGDDLDPGFIGATNFIIAKVKDGKAHVEFNQRIYESGEKVYDMKGKLKDGLLLTTHHYFYCPIFNCWWINISFIMGEGVVKTTDTDFPVFFRNSFPIIMPNTEGKYVSVQILIFLSLTAEYYEVDPNDPFNPATIPWDEEPLVWEEGVWILAAVLWDVGIPMDVGFGYGIVPVGPASYLTMVT
ncbi:MAG: hypothetical protein ACFFB4_04285 [Promethearchaeota archaeon]